MTAEEMIKELIFGKDDAINKPKTYKLFEDGDFNVAEENKRKIKEFEEELNIKWKHNKLPWEAK